MWEKGFANQGELAIVNSGEGNSQETLTLILDVLLEVGRKMIRQRSRINLSAQSFFAFRDAEGYIIAEEFCCSCSP